MTYKISLAKAHIIEKRLREAEVNIQLDFAKRRARIEPEMNKTAEDILDQFEDDRTKRIGESARILMLIRAQTAVRTAIGEANYKSGVFSKIKELEGLQKEINFLESFSHISTTIDEVAVKASKLAQAAAQAENFSEGFNLLSRSPFDSDVLLRQDHLDAQEEIKRIRKAINRLNDDISTLNHTNFIEISLNPEIAELVGLEG